MVPMPRKPQDYDDIPGTFVFDAERSRQGYGINMFCMSLMKEDNRKAFKADEAEYLKAFKLTPEQTEAILQRDYNRMLELGGNIYFTAKLGATDGHSFRHLAATMTGSTQDDYAAMMLAGGRSVEGNRSRSGRDILAKAGKPKARKAARGTSKTGALKKSASKKTVSKKTGSKTARKKTAAATRTRAAAARGGKTKTTRAGTAKASSRKTSRSRRG
jgi:protocatechuate 4,5-dioxygenase alpha chain